MGQNCCPLITHAKWAERMRRTKNVLKRCRKGNKFRKFNQTKQQREYSSTGRALALQARGSGIETLCFHFLLKKRQSDVLILGPLGYEPNALTTALLSLH